MRPRNSSFRKHGRYAGLSDFRYGDINTKPISLAGPKKPKHSKPIFSPGKRKHVLLLVIDELRDWRRTPLEDEASLRHGMRSSLCLQGHNWHAAAAEAAGLVAQALKLIGVLRPSWEEGQRGYVDPRENCSWCGAGIVEGHRRNAYRFCSEACARMALEKRDFERREQTDRMYASARRIILKARTRPRNCQWCDEPFHPLRETSTQTCCSYKCSGNLKASRGILPKSVLAQSETRQCHFCGANFETRSADGKYCSNACSTAFYKIEKGKIPQKIRPHVFDHFITVPVNAAPRRLVPGSFDWLLMERGLKITGEMRMTA